MKKLLLSCLFLLALAQPAAAEGRKISILFIGNSYTYANDMPRMVASVAAGDPGNSLAFEVQAATIGGKTLQVLWSDREIRKTFASRKWDYVVLQEQSEWALYPAQVEATAASVAAWSQAIRQAGGKPLIYVTWARQPGSFWYTDRQYSALHDPKYMQRQLDLHSAELAAQSGAVLVPVGDAFAAALKAEPEMPLYAEDSSHPSLLGSYLAALVFYEILSGRSAEKSAYVPPGLLPETAETLRRIAVKMAPK